jgi:hypothetical protein
VNEIKYTNSEKIKAVAVYFLGLIVKLDIQKYYNVYRIKGFTISVSYSSVYTYEFKKLPFFLPL